MQALHLLWLLYWGFVLHVWQKLGVQVMAQLVDMRVTDVCGFDLSYLNRYRWGCAAEKVDLSRWLHLPGQPVMLQDKYASWS